MLIIGVDGATWDIIKPNIEELPTFKKLIKEFKTGTIHLNQKPWSASVWCSMFSGKTPEEHNHLDFIKDGKIQTREDINVEFIWDLLERKGISIKAVNIPFIVPPYNYNAEFLAPGNGVPITDQENEQEITAVKETAEQILKNNKPEVFICVFTALDKMSHMHWGEPILLEYYKKVDQAIQSLIQYDDEIIILSDHGFCNYDEAPTQTLPKVTKSGHVLKGDHHPDAILLTKNIKFEIKQPMDIFHCIKNKYLEE